MSTYVRMIHKADLYSKSTTTTAAGQKKPVWSKVYDTIKCAYIPQFNDSRNALTQPVYEIGRAHV